MARSGILTTTAFAALSASLAASLPVSAQTVAAAPAVGAAAAPAAAVPADATTEPTFLTLTSFTTDELAMRGIVSTSQLLAYVPNALSANVPGLGSANIYYIRGLGSSQSLSTFDPPVMTSVDGVTLTRQIANNFGFFDTDRIDVRRGPQGTTGGRNTSGGMVDVSLKQPGDRLAGYFEGGYGSYEEKEFRGSIDIPFTTGIAVKLSGYLRDDHGYAIDTTTNERTNTGNAAGLRGAVRLDVTDRLSWNAAVAYMRNDGDNLLNFDCDPRNAGKCAGRFLTSSLRQSYDAGHPSPFAALGVTGRKANFGLGDSTDTILTTSDLAYAGDGFTVDVITGVASTKQRSGIDFADGRGFPTTAVPNPVATTGSSGGYTTLNDTRDQQFSQEVRIGGALLGDRVNYVVGAYYLDEGDTTDIASILTTAGTPRLLADRTLRNTTRSTAGYVQLDAKLTERLRLTGGVRYTDETRSFHVSDNRAACQVAPTTNCLSDANLVAGGIAIPTSQSARVWTPRVALDYQLPGVLVFASATRGFTGGGWNASGTTPGSLLPFDPQKVWSYEAGAKTDLFDHRLRLAATAFYLDTKGFQATSTSIDPSTGGLASSTQNVGYRNRGVEVEATATPLKHLNVFANLGYQHDNYRVSDTLLPNQYGVKAVRQQQADCRAELAARQVPLAPIGATNAADCATGIVDANGNIASPVRTPTFSAAIGGSYDYAIPAAGIILEPSVNVIYRSSFETGTANASLYSGTVTTVGGGTYPANPFGGALIGGSRAPSYTVANAALALKTDDNNWVVSLECNNCLDRNYAAATLGNYTYLAPPRTFLVRAKRTF